MPLLNLNLFIHSVIHSFSQKYVTSTTMCVTKEKINLVFMELTLYWDHTAPKVSYLLGVRNFCD